MFKVPSEMLIHKCVFHEYDGEDIYHQRSYKPSVTLNNVRIDMSNIYTVGGNDEQIIGEGVLFFYPKQSNVDSAISTDNNTIFKKKSKVEWNGEEYFINKVIPVYEPFQNVIACIEMELV